MSKARNLVLPIALVAVVITGYLLLNRTVTTIRDHGDDSPHQAATRENVDEPPNPFAQVNANGTAPDPTLHPRNEVADCLSLTDFESDPVLSAEYARFDSLVTSGPTIESYRGLSSAALAGLAGQRDSAAMAVLGAMSVKKAMNLPEDNAVAYLLLEEPRVQSYDFEQPMNPETTMHLEEARDWFYRAAVHGRLLALQSAGEIISILGGTPSDLGWIPQEEYESLESFERLGLDPENLYGALAFEIAPELRSGPLGTMMAESTPGGERQQLILHELAWRFSQDREAAGLPPIDIPVSTAPSLEELESLPCEQ